MDDGMSRVVGPGGCDRVENGQNVAFFIFKKFLNDYYNTYCHILNFQAIWRTKNITCLAWLTLCLGVAYPSTKGSIPFPGVYMKKAKADQSMIGLRILIVPFRQ